MTRKWGKQKDWPSISARIDPKVKAKLREKFPDDGQISQLLRALLHKYLEGKIIGIKLEVQ